MKRLKEMKKPCIRVLSIMLVVIVTFVAMTQPLLAKQADNPLPGSKIEQEYTRAINKLERYLSISETGNIVLDAPKGIVNSIDSEVYQSLLAGLEQTNSMIDSGYLVANPDFTLTVTEQYSVEGIQALSSSGGIDDFVPYWWGCWIYLSDATCDEIVFQLGIGAGVTGLTAIILAALGFTAPAGAIMAVVSLLLGVGATVIGQYNVNNTGIRIRLHGYIIPTYIGPQ